MLREELTKELLMEYDELTVYLKEKYGPAKYDYFCNESCKTVNRKASRSSEGLQCHHIDEDKYSNLSSPALAKQHSFDYQKKDRLVYCNLIEHCLLHHKINEMTQAYLKMFPTDISGFFNSHGVFHTSGLINDLFAEKGSTVPYLQHYYDAIKDNYDDYIWMVTMILKNLESSYRGEKTPRKIFSDSLVQVHGVSGIIKGYTENSYTINIEFENGMIESVNPREIDNLSYLDYIEGELRAFSAGNSGTYYETIYDDIHERMLIDTDEDVSVLEKLKKKTEKLAEKTLVYIDDLNTPVDITFNDNKKLIAGERIYDYRYGLGTIIEVDTAFTNPLLKIKFDTKGVKHIPKDEFVERNIALKE